MRKITVFELIYLIKKNPPKRLVYGERVYEYIEKAQDYKSGNQFLLQQLVSKFGSWLDNEVEVIEE